jgi:hypothetical protein
MTRPNAKIMAEHVVEFGLYQNSASKDATVSSADYQKNHTTWNHEQGGEISLEYAGCEFSSEYTGLTFGGEPNRNIDGDIHFGDGFTPQNNITFDNYQVSIPHKYGTTDIFVNQDLESQAMCPRYVKDAGVLRPGLIYGPERMIGTNHTYQVPNAGLLRLTYGELIDETHSNSTSTKDKLGLFGSDTGRACSAEYCHDVSKVCGIKHGSRKAEVSMRVTRISNINGSQISFNNGITTAAKAVIRGMHTLKDDANKSGGANQCEFSMRLCEPCKDNLVVNVNTAADNKVIGGEISYERHVRLGSWCSPATGGCPDRVGIKFQVPDYLRSGVTAGKDYKDTQKAEKNTPSICQISYCTRFLGFDVPMFIARANNIDGDSKSDAWLCGVQPRAELCLEHDAEWKGCPCPEGGEDEDNE